MEIPLHLVPLLTANGQEPLRRICASSGAEIALRQDMQHYGYNLAFITGPPQATALAKEMVMHQIGLTGGSVITKEVEVSGDPMNSLGAIEMALSELRNKAMGVQMSIVPPRVAGERGRISIGPGPVAHIAVAETCVRKKLADIELDLCYKQGRPVPLDLKLPLLCKYFEAGSCSLAAKCQYCHGREELSVAQHYSRPRGVDNNRSQLPQLTASPSPPPATGMAPNAAAARNAAMMEVPASGRTSETSALL